MTMSNQQNSDTLIMSSELEDRLSYLREKRTDDVPKLCFIKVPGIDIPFKMIGWDIFPDYITIETPEYHLHHFFDIKDELDVSIFGATLTINNTAAVCEDGVWKVRLFIHRV